MKTLKYEVIDAAKRPYELLNMLGPELLQCVGERLETPLRTKLLRRWWTHWLGMNSEPYVKREIWLIVS